MSTKLPKGRVAPAKPATSAETALPQEGAGKASATTLSGAFAAALGAKPQMSHPGSKGPQGKSVKSLVAETGAPRIVNSKPGAPTVPRKGHR